MHRFFVSADAIQGQSVRFAPDQSRQLRHVLRLRSGDEVLVLDGAGACYRVILEHQGKHETSGQILDRIVATGEPAGQMILCQAIARADRFEWVLQKGTELGVTRFQPMITERTVARAAGANKWERWQRIIREAAEQSGRGIIPELAEPVLFEEALSGARGLILFPALTTTTPAMQTLAGARWPATIFVGPEGGFTPEEVEEAREAGIEPIGLGARVLRTETAALVMLTLAAAALGEFDRPTPKPMLTL